ncbi:ATP-binding protein [Pseudomonas sp. SCA2728.1_7]|uniref:ATP-dependent nuclease n=1 Tax=Pseudomonas sp. SCA2728.1_7 TaxID=2825975 RepID=UPI001BAE7CFF|nr:ATP-binding protein [Pseudomonas sp. SCA2728.1_7]QUE91092.1 AAA family ATPase [Pseudomonas sp. SCA2728.1_7]
MVLYALMGAQLITITSIRFNNFKALKQYSISLDQCNILVGPNNAGKSTIISAFRILEAALRAGYSRRPEYVYLDEKRVLGHKVPVSGLPVSLENVHTDYEYSETKIEFRFSNSNKIFLNFPEDGGCVLTWECVDNHIKTPSAFKKAFPFSVQVVPVLGPLEHEEPIVAEETVRRSLGTPRACRHFRNFWLQNPDGFESFRELIESSWPGMSISRPERSSSAMVMFCTESRMDREVFWAGFGFQVWCQLLTHLSRSKSFSLTVIDEPEVYLHPDLQRQLLAILRDQSNEFVIATHSTEIMGEADPSEIMIIDKSKRSAKRVKDIEGVQEALISIGSIQNITLTQLARNKKILFSEGDIDYKIIRRFAKKLKFTELSSGNDITQLASEGYSSWPKVQALAWGLKSTPGSEIKIAAIYDRDFWCDDEIAQVEKGLKSNLAFAHVHRRKEIENYLLVPSVLKRCVNKAVADRASRNGENAEEVDVGPELERISKHFEATVQGQYIAKYVEFHRSCRKDSAVLNTEAIQLFNNKWQDLETRMEVVCGKDFLREFRSVMSSVYSITLTDFKIIDEFKVSEIPADLVSLLSELEQYRAAL